MKEQTRRTTNDNETMSSGSKHSQDGKADRKYHHGNLRTALLKAVGEIIRESGVESLTLRACARRVGVSHGAPARHFPDLRSLLTEFASEGFDRMAATMDTALAETPNDPLYASGIGYIRFAVEFPEQFRIMWTGGILDESSPRLQAARVASGELLFRALVTAYVELHHAMPDEATLNTRFTTAWCSVHGYAMLWAEVKESWPVRLADARAMLLMVRTGLVAK